MKINYLNTIKAYNGLVANNLLKFSKISLFILSFTFLSTYTVSGQMHIATTSLQGGSVNGISEATVTIGNVEVVQPSDPYQGPVGIVRTGCDNGIPISIEICNVEENGIITFSLDNSQWFVSEPGDFNLAAPTSPFVTTYEATVAPTTTDSITGVEECITKTIVVSTIPGSFMLFPEVKSYTDLVFNSQSNVDVNLAIPTVVELQSNPVGSDGSSILLSEIDDASVFLDPLQGVVADVQGKFPPAAIACGGDNSASYAISGELLIDIDYCFQNMNFVMRPGSSIKIINGAKLSVSDQNNQTMLNDPEFIPCGAMWKGIIVEDGELYINDALVQGAEVGITIEPNNKLGAKYSTFEDNYIGIDFVGNQSAQAPYNCDFGLFYGLEFLGTGNLYNQYDGQATTPPTNDLPIAGIQAEDYLFLPLTGVKSVGGNIPNTYNNMTYGIKLKNTDANTSYSIFNDIIETGIAALSTFRNSNNLTHNGYNPNPFNNQVESEEIDFLNCEKGITVGNMNATIQESQFLDIKTGIQFTGCKNKNVFVKKNRIMSDINGIVSVFSTPLSGTIKQNVFSPTAINKQGTNIVCYEDFASSASPGNSWRILNNTMENYLGGKRGIMITNGTNFELKDNDLIINSNQVIGANGIVLESSHFPELDCNSIDNVGTKIDKTGGLKVTASISGEYECNEISGWGNGVLFNNDNMSNLFKANDMSSCKTGLTFNNTAIIGTQSHKGNCWGNNDNADLSHASGEGAFIQLSQFIINCGDEGSSTACGCDATVHVGMGAVTADLLREVSFGVTESCEIEGCRNGRSKNGKVVTDDLYSRLNDGIYPENQNEESLHWLSQFNIMKFLDNEESSNVEETTLANNFRANHPDLNNFLNLWSSIDKIYEQAHHDHSTLQSAYSDINNLYYEMQNTHDQQEMDNLQAQLETMLNNYKMMKVDESASLSQIQLEIINSFNSYSNSTVSSATHIQNMSFVTDLYRADQLDANYKISPSELSELNSIATTCIDIAGPATSLAKSLYFKFSDGVILESADCIDVRRSEARETSPVSASKLFPNPTKDEVNLTLSEAGEVQIFDQKGVLIKTYLLDKGNQVIKLNLAPGVYFVSDNKSIKEKLVIIK